MAGDADGIRSYHEQTKHSPARLHSDPHTLDWGNMPRPFKVYPDLDGLPLSHDLTTSTRPALGALLDAGPATKSTVDRRDLARLLYLSAGVLRRRSYPGGEIFFRAAACTGALYHIDLYVVCGELPDLEAGVYHFGPHDFALRRLRAGDHRAALVEAAAGESAVRGAPAVLVYTSTFWRNAWKYRARAYRHAFWDAGTILANLLAVAAAAALPAHVVQSFVDAEVNRLLDLDVEREVALGLVALGAGAPPPPPGPAISPLGLATLPPSAREIAYPLIGSAHAATSLASDEDVVAARVPVPAPPLDGPGLALQPLPADTVLSPIERVILRRGSTRRFPHEPIGVAELATILQAAAQPLDTDCPVTPEPYLIVHGVDGLDPGTYALDVARLTLVPLRAGRFRGEAGHLGLGQDLPAEAAVNIYWLVDLEAVLARQGARGYRSAQLAAAVAGGRTYLAAYALGLGATGLTFFDDDVTTFFSPRAAGRSVMFLMAIGQRPGRGRAAERE
jgi:SagB-type dehydrogenase family enzyme